MEAVKGKDYFFGQMEIVVCVRNNNVPLAVFPREHVHPSDTVFDND